MGYLKNKMDMALNGETGVLKDVKKEISQKLTEQAFSEYFVGLIERGAFNENTEKIIIFFTLIVNNYVTDGSSPIYYELALDPKGKEGASVPGIKTFLDRDVRQVNWLNDAIVNHLTSILSTFEDVVDINVKKVKDYNDKIPRFSYEISFRNPLI